MISIWVCFEIEVVKTQFLLKIQHFHLGMGGGSPKIPVKLTGKLLVKMIRLYFSHFCWRFLRFAELDTLGTWVLGSHESMDIHIQNRWFGIPDKSMLDSAGTFTTFKHEKYIEDDGNSQDFFSGTSTHFTPRFPSQISIAITKPRWRRPWNRKCNLAKTNLDSGRVDRVDTPWNLSPPKNATWNDMIFFLMGELGFVEWKRSDSWICCENYRSFEGFSCFVIHQWDWADFLWCSVTLFVQTLPFGIGNGWLCRGERSMLTCPFPAREKVAKQKEKVVENDPDTKRHTFFWKELQQQWQQWQQQQQQQQQQKSAHHSELMASLNSRYNGKWTSKMSCHGFRMVRVFEPHESSFSEFFKQHHYPVAHEHGCIIADSCFLGIPNPPWNNWGVVGAAQWGFAVGVFVATAFLHTSCRIFGSDSSTSQAKHSDMRKIQKDNYSTHEGFGWVSNASNFTNSCSPKSRKGRVADQDSPWHCGCHQHLHSDANDASVQPLKLHIGPCFVNVMSIWWCFHHLFEGPNTCIVDIGCYLKVRFSVRTWTPQVQLQYEHVSNPFHQKSICNTPRWVITASQQISSTKPSQGGHTSKEVRNLVDESRCLEIQLNDRTKNEAPQYSKWLKEVNQTQLFWMVLAL